jgi:hypothetical protein
MTHEINLDVVDVDGAVGEAADTAAKVLAAVKATGFIV